jgi:phage gp29-like protein
MDSDRIILNERLDATPTKRIIVSRENSVEWADLWGYLPDPDPILFKSGMDVRIFEEILCDPHVLSCYQSRKSGTLTSEWKLEYPAKALKYQEFFDYVMKSLRMQQIIAEILDYWSHGFSILEIEWKLFQGKWYPASIDQKPNEWFVFDGKNDIRFLSKKHPEEGEKLPPNKFLIARHYPSFKNPYGIRTLSRCFWPVTFKKAGYKYWAIFMEKFGVPWMLGKVPRGTDSDQRQTLLDMLQNMIQSSCAVINDDESVEMVNAKAANATTGENVFETMIDFSNKEISKVILGQTLSTEISNKGSYAASSSHMDVRNDLSMMDKHTVAECFNKLLAWISWINFGLDEHPYIKFLEEEDAKEAHSRRDSQLYTQGVRMNSKYYQRQYHLREDEFEVVDQDQMEKDDSVPGEAAREKERKKETRRKEDAKSGKKEKKD